MAAKAKDIDWDRMEPDWRAGIVSVSTLSREYSVSRTSIEKHWNKLGVPRDLTAKIKAKTDSIVMGANIEAEKGAGMGATNKAATEKQIIEVNANIQATVILEEREDVKRLTRICELLEKQLETIANDPDSEEDLEKKARINKTLIESRDKVFNMRRRNYGINDNANGDADKDGSFESMLNKRNGR